MVCNAGERLDSDDHFRSAHEQKAAGCPDGQHIHEAKHSELQQGEHKQEENARDCTC